MKPSLTDSLCTMCGLCCDGSLLADVELAGIAEVTTLTVLGLDVEEPDQDHKGLLLLPCGALRGTRCSIYEHRPNCCRTFECRLLQQVRRGAVPLVDAQASVTDARSRIARVGRLIAALGQPDDGLPLRERCAEVLASSEAVDSDPRKHRMRVELEAEMASLEQVFQSTFLDG